jgi:chaperonin GroEL
MRRTLCRQVTAIEAEEKSRDGDEKAGLRILKRALETPARQIAEPKSATPPVPEL